MRFQTLAKGEPVPILGAAGAVGRCMLRLLAERGVPAEQVVALASPRSAGQRLPYGNQEVVVHALEGARSFAGARLALFSAGAAVSRETAPLAAGAGALVIDNSSAWRMEPDVPLVVPEVNLATAAERPRGIIANPNCSTIQLVVVLHALRQVAGLRRVVVSTYQAISGAGARAVAELDQQARDDLANHKVIAEILPYPIFGNVIFHDVKDDSASTEEEGKIVRETRRILDMPKLRITATCVRVPVRVGHSEAVWIETEEKLSPKQAREVLSGTTGVIVEDDPKARKYPMPRVIAGTEPIYVGRIRQDDSVENGLAMWVVADNLLKGAALNAVQIAEQVTL